MTVRVKPNGYTIYDGPSEIDGAPIVAVITGYRIPTANKKMGLAPLQTWILRKDVSPLDATASGDDRSICGDCPHRGASIDGRNVGRSCYVEVHFGVRNLWLAQKRGNYPVVERVTDLINLGYARGIRLGSYGDPAAVPFHIWRSLTHAAVWSMGYTHQWRTARESYQSLCMASVDTAAEQTQAKALGWRTFRVRRAQDPVEEYEIVCPASKEAGRKATCQECRACSGVLGKAKADVTIIAHGPPGRVANYGRSVA